MTVDVLIIFYILVMQCSHTFQMRKFKGISRVIKRSTAPFQGYFWKTVVTLLYVNKISSNFTYLFQNLFWPMQHSKEVSIIFLKNSWWQNRMKFREKKYICVWSIFLCLSQISRGFKVFTQNFQGSRSQNKFQVFQGFQEAMGTLVMDVTSDIQFGWTMYHYWYHPCIIIGIIHVSLLVSSIYWIDIWYENFMTIMIFIALWYATNENSHSCWCYKCEWNLQCFLCKQSL